MNTNYLSAFRALLAVVSWSTLDKLIAKNERKRVICLVCRIVTAIVVVVEVPQQRL
jgi:hypothetical protein